MNRQDKELETASDNLSVVIDSRSASLRGILKEVTGLEFTFELPQSMLALLEAAGLITEGGIPLQMRGDGIQGLTVPGILNYLSSQSRSKFYFWGFEEPENSLEYIKATRLAEDIYEKYSKKAQIFLSTHSPAFLAMQNDRTTIYRVSQKPETPYRGYTEDVTEIKPVFSRGKDYQDESLSEELGFFERARKFDREEREIENQKDEIKTLKEEIRQLTEPILIVEGKHDLATLKHAWKRLYTKSMPFKIIEVRGVKEITKLIEQLLIHINERRLCALYDHDRAGIEDIKKLKGFDIHKRDDGTYKCTYGEKILAMTLPVPEIPGREAQAKNLNLTLEFYFSDSVLMGIDEQPRCELFSTTTYIEKGKSTGIDKDKLKTLVDARDVTIVHRQVKEPGKSRLVESLANLPDKEFKAFHKLFEIIVGHLAPDFDLTSIKKEIQQLPTPAAKD